MDDANEVDFMTLLEWYEKKLAQATRQIAVLEIRVAELSKAQEHGLRRINEPH